MQEHINLILSKILFDKKDDFVEPEFTIALNELYLTNKVWSDRDELRRALKFVKGIGRSLNYENLAKEYSSKKANDLFEFSIPVDYPLYKDITLNGVQIQVLSGESLGEKIRIIEFCKNDNAQITAIVEQLKKENNLRLINFKILHGDYQNAILHFNSTFSLLKGVLEYSYTMWNWSWGADPYNRKTSTFFYPNFILSVGNGFSEILKPSRNTSSTSKPNDERIPLKKLHFYLDYLSTIKKKTGLSELLSDVFRLFGLAKDAKTNREAFLLYWNVLEKLMEPLNGTGSTQIILRRANIFQFAGFNHFKNFHKQIGNIRNDLVHRGIDNVEELYIGYLSLLITNTIDFLFDNIKIIDSLEKLDTLHMFCSIPYSDLSNNLELINKVVADKR